MSIVFGIDLVYFLWFSDTWYLYFTSRLGNVVCCYFACVLGVVE